MDIYVRSFFHLTFFALVYGMPCTVTGQVPAQESTSSATTKASSCPPGQVMTLVKKVKEWGKDTDKTLLSGCAGPAEYKSVITFGANPLTAWDKVEKDGAKFFTNVGQCAGRTAWWDKGVQKGDVLLFSGSVCGGWTKAEITRTPEGGYRIETSNQQWTNPDEYRITFP